MRNSVQCSHFGNSANNSVFYYRTRRLESYIVKNAVTDETEEMRRVLGGCYLRGLTQSDGTHISRNCRITYLIRYRG